MQHGHLYQGLPSGQRHIQAGEVVFHHGELLPPGGLIADGGRIVPLGLSFHGIPGQVGHPHRDPQRRLPVPLQLVSPKVVVPSRDPVELAEHALRPGLAHHGLDLLGRGVLAEIAEHVHARKAEGRIAAHGIPYRLGLVIEGALPHHMSGEVEPMLSAPAPNLLAIALHEEIRDQVLEPPAGRGEAPVRPLPEELRQGVQKLLPIGLAVSFRKPGGPGQEDILGFIREVQASPGGELWLVREDGGRELPEMFPHVPGVGLMGDADELRDGLRIQGVHIGLVVEPGIRGGVFHVGVPAHCAFLHRLLFRYPTRPFQLTVPVQQDVIDCQEPPVFLADVLLPPAGFGGRRFGEGALLVRIRGEEQGFPGVLRSARGHPPPCGAGGPAVLVVEPGQHVHLPGLSDAVPDGIHELFLQVGAVHPRAHMHVEPAQAHLFEDLDLFREPVPVQPAVPGPEGRPSVLAGRISEQLSGNVLCLVLFV